MENKLTWFLVLLSLIPIVSADLVLPLSTATLPLFPIVITIEIIGFWLLTTKAFNIKVGFWKTFLIVAVANIVTSIIATFIPTPYSAGPDPTNTPSTIARLTIPLLVSFVLSVFIEFVIFLLFFLKKNVRKIDLFCISGIVNAASYLVLFLIFSFLS